MNVIWLRGVDHVSFDRPYSWFVSGVRGTGKSSLLEALGEQHLSRGHTVLDLFGSRDGEGLGWCRSPWVEEKRLLLVHGPNVSVDSSWDTVAVDNLSLAHFGKYDLVVSSSPLYSSISSEFLEVNKITDLLYTRLHWRKLVFSIVREAANLYYSRLKVDPNQSQAKAGMIYLIREARHVGMGMGLDTLKMTSIDLDVRAVTDFLLFKSQGVLGLPRDLYFIYRIIKPSELANMPPNKFVILHRGGSLGVGHFNEIPWHKKEQEDILRAVGVKVEYGEELDYGSDKGSFRTVGDLEHIEIVKLYAEGHSMSDVGNLQSRSPATISNQVKDHNKRVAKTGFCARCKRAGGEFFEAGIRKGGIIE